MWQAQQMHDDVDYAEIEAMRESAARRSAQIELCIKCREFHPLAPDEFRHQYMRQASNGRTSSSKNATLEELRAAIELVGPVLVEEHEPTPYYMHVSYIEGLDSPCWEY